jgi:hypothetical protein
VAVILALHLVHIIFYQPLVFVDWLHHVVMVVVMLPLAWGLQPGTSLAHGAFYSSGLPGGLDYLMLVLVKWGWMASISEKRWNTSIQLWIRAPGCLAHAYLCWLLLIESRKRVADGLSPVPNAVLPDWAIEPAMAVVFITFFWNGKRVIGVGVCKFTKSRFVFRSGLYFLRRVIESQTRHEMKIKSMLKKKE